MNKELPIVVARYTEGDWPAWMALCPVDMCDTWEEWNEGIEDLYLDAARNRSIVHVATIHPEPFQKWAEEHSKPMNGYSRGEFAGLQIKDRFLQTYESPAEFPKQAEVTRMLRRAVTTNPDISLSDVSDPYLRRPQAGVCPLFREDNAGDPEHFGSGVLIRIADHHFLISAAHVLDEFKAHMILIPGREHLVELSGEYSVTQIPNGRSRDDDDTDFGYLHFKGGFESQLHKSLIFLDRHDCDLMDSTGDGDAYTVIGYQADLSDFLDDTATNELTRISCSGVNDHRYDKLNLNPQTHLLLQYRMKKGISYKTMIPGKKHDFGGMSGGGAFAWSKDLPNPHAMAQPHLVGITTGYSPYHNVFLVTRLGSIIAGIQKEFPDLPISRKPRE